MELRKQTTSDKFYASYKIDGILQTAVVGDFGIVIKHIVDANADDVQHIKIGDVLEVEQHGKTNKFRR